MRFCIGRRLGPPRLFLSGMFDRAWFDVAPLGFSFGLGILVWHLGFGFGFEFLVWFGLILVRFGPVWSGSIPFLFCFREAKLPRIIM